MITTTMVVIAGIVVFLGGFVILVSEVITTVAPVLFIAFAILLLIAASKDPTGVLSIIVVLTVLCAPIYLIYENTRPDVVVTKITKYSEYITKGSFLVTFTDGLSAGTTLVQIGNKYYTYHKTKSDESPLTRIKDFDRIYYGRWYAETIRTIPYKLYFVNGDF